MSHLPQEVLEQAAEAVVFAHEAELAEQAATLRQQPAGAATLDELERTAALAAATRTGGFEPPAGLSARLAADALAFCATRDTGGGDAGASGDTRVVSFSRSPRTPFASFLLGAAAACLVVWFAFGRGVEPTAEQVRTAALSQPDGFAQQAWQAGPSPRSGKPRGDVVWRQAEQDGWLTFQGLPELPEHEAYQLWIVDGNREGDPVDGGVFSIADAAAETVVPIRAKLPIGKATTFVVTIERREGVVVSGQKHVVALASL